jgi:hypothetical protein
VLENLERARRNRAGYVINALKTAIAEQAA